MNYIEQINVFWLLDAEHSFNGNETRLYFYLLKLSNSLYWKNPVTNADGHTALNVGISVNTMKTARNRLQQAGLIQFQSGGQGARVKTQYYILEAENVMNKVSTIDTLSAKTLIPNPPPNSQNSDHIYKHKQDQTKQDKTLPAPAAPAPKNAREKNKKNREKEAEPYWQRLVQTWCDFNVEKFGGAPSFEGPDPRDLKQILGRLKKRAALNALEWTEEIAVARFTGFLQACYEDDWLATHFLLSNLLKQFDKIILNQRGKRSTTSSPHRIDRPVITGRATGAGEL